MVMRSTLVSARRAAFRAAVLAAACAFAPSVFAQANDKMTPIVTPDQRNAIEVGTGPLPDAKAQESWHSQYGSKFARNVTVATITPFLPDPAKASGAAVVVALGALAARIAAQIVEATDHSEPQPQQGPMRSRVVYSFARLL